MGCGVCPRGSRHDCTATAAALTHTPDLFLAQSSLLAPSWIGKKYASTKNEGHRRVIWWSGVVWNGAWSAVRGSQLTYTTRA